MGRFERDLKKKVKGTKKDYAEWYGEHEKEIMQCVEEADSEVDQGNVKIKKRATGKIWIFVSAALLLITIIAVFGIMMDKNGNRVPAIPNLTFGEENVKNEVMNDEDINEVVSQFPQITKLVVIDGISIVYIEDGSVVMNVINGELETPDDFYLVNAKISYTDNFAFFDKWEYEELENKKVINGTTVEYGAKGTDDYGMYQYCAFTRIGDVKLYWRVSCIEGLIDDWLQVMFS